MLPTAGIVRTPSRTSDSSRSRSASAELPRERRADERLVEPVAGEADALELLLAERGRLDGAVEERDVLARAARRGPCRSSRACWIPQSSAQRATYVPGGALNHVSLMRPGIASILPPSCGTHQLWLTSFVGRGHVEVHDRVGRRDHLVRSRRAVRVAEEPVELVRLDRDPRLVWPLAAGASVMRQHARRRTAASATRTTVGTSVQTELRVPARSVCGPSSVRGARAAAVADHEQRRARPRRAGTRPPRARGSTDVDVADPLGVRRFRRGGRETAAPGRGEPGQRKCGRGGQDEDEGSPTHAGSDRMRAERRRCACANALAHGADDARRPARLRARAVRGVRERRAAGRGHRLRGRRLEPRLQHGRSRARASSGPWRWLSMLLGIAGTYRKNDKIDVVFTRQRPAEGRRRSRRAAGRAATRVRLRRRAVRLAR